MSEQEDARAVTLGGQIAGGRDAQWLDHAAVSRQRMARDVEPEHLLLERETLIGFPLRCDLGGRARPGRRRHRRHHLEEGALALRAVALLTLAALERRVGGGQQMGAREAERVERPRLDEALHHAPVDEPQIDPRAEVLQGPERPLVDDKQRWTKSVIGEQARNDQAAVIDETVRMDR